MHKICIVYILSINGGILVVYAYLLCVLFDVFFCRVRIVG